MTVGGTAMAESEPLGSALYGICSALTGRMTEPQADSKREKMKSSLERSFKGARREVQ
jgi:hypothetical protein